MFTVNDRLGKPLHIDDQVTYYPGEATPVKGVVIAFFTPMEIQVVVEGCGTVVANPSQVEVTYSLYAELISAETLAELKALFEKAKENVKIKASGEKEKKPRANKGGRPAKAITTVEEEC